MKNDIRRKLVIVGDGGCGKTCLLSKFALDQMLQDFIPTVSEIRVKDIIVDDKHIELVLWDTAGQEDYDRLRPLAYPNTDIVLFSFSIDQPDSLDNVEERWVPEIRHFCQDVPCLLVGCKKDLRMNRHMIDFIEMSGGTLVVMEEAEAVAKRIGAVMYLECSSLTGEGVMEVFENAAKYSRGPSDKKRKPGKCLIL